MNLRVIGTLRDAFPTACIGLSDHYNGIAMAVAAYVLGARIIEKHFTLNHTWRGTDHALSLEPVGMRKMVRDLRRARLALGDGVKRLLPARRAPWSRWARPWSPRAISRPGISSPRADVAVKSPGGGLPPYELDRLLGRRLSQALRADDVIRFEHLLASVA